MKGTAVKSATKTATAKATCVIATAAGRTLTVKDTVNGAEVRMVINELGGLERELVGCVKHDKQYGNNIAVAVGYTVPNLMNKKLGVAKNLQAIAKTINDIPAKNIRNLSNRLRRTINAKYDLVQPYTEEYKTCPAEKRGFFAERSA